MEMLVGSDEIMFIGRVACVEDVIDASRLSRVI